MIETLIDGEKLKEALNIIKPAGSLFEVRILKGKMTISGYFTDTSILMEQFKKVDLRNANVFYTLNEIDEACYAREQHDIFRQVTLQHTSGY